MTRKKTLSGPCGVKLHLDLDEVFPDDPGAGTPALVEYQGHFGTWWCVTDTADCDGRTVPAKVMKWLEDQSNEVEAVEQGRLL